MFPELSNNNGIISTARNEIIIWLFEHELIISPISSKTINDMIKAIDDIILNGFIDNEKGGT